MKIGPILFQPIYQERVWGGRRLASLPGRNLPDDRLIGESWDVVDRPEAQSAIRHPGHWKGRTLRSVLENFGPEVLGPNIPADRPFPILVKWLDCRERLSLQVHPPASVAHELGGEPKTENWFIADTYEPDASLLVGLRPGVTREGFARALENNTLEDCVHRIKIQPGDSILVESGRLHAIDAGNLILEIQQNSDTTYRVYDWGRLGLDGKPRTLHTRESMACIDFSDFAPEPLRAASVDRVMADCREFRIRQYVLEPGATPLHLEGNSEPRLLHVVRGTVALGENLLPAGETALLPYCDSFSVEARTDALVLITDHFLTL